MQPYDGHIGVQEGVILVFALLSAMLFLQYPQFLVEVGGPAGWQVALIMTLGAMLLLVPASALARRFPGMGLAEISREAAGSVVGPLLTLLVSLWLFASCVLTLRSFTETFITTILPDTPPSPLMISAALCALFASYKGLESIARATQILLPLIAGGSLLVLLFSLPRLDVSLLYPFWGHGGVPTLMGGLYYSSMAADVVVILAVGYAFRDPGHLRTSGMVGTLLFGLGAIAVVFVLVGIFGAPIASQNPFPLYNLARLIYLGRFLQRTESVIVMFWVLAALVRISVLLHASAVTLSGALGLPQYRPLLFPLAVLLIPLALLPQDFLTSLRIDRDVIRPLGFVAVLAIPLLLWLLALLRRKGGKRHAT